MRYLFALIGFISVSHVGYYFAGNTFQWEYYDSNLELIRATIYISSFMTALFGYNLNTDNKKYGYALVVGIIVLWITTLIKATFFIRLGMEFPFGLTLVQLVIVFLASFSTYKKIG